MSACTREQGEQVCLYALGVLPANEVPEVKAHINECPECSTELETLHPLVTALAQSSDLLRPSKSLWGQLARRISGKPVLPQNEQGYDFKWVELGPGISAVMLASDPDRDLVSLLVRLGPGVAYPCHAHAAVEEVHILHGEIWVDGRKLGPGDYNRAEAGSIDKSVCTLTGCTAFVVTSTRDRMLV